MSEKPESSISEGLIESKIAERTQKATKNRHLARIAGIGLGLLSMFPSAGHANTEQHVDGVSRDTYSYQDPENKLANTLLENVRLQPGVKEIKAWQTTGLNQPLPNNFDKDFTYRVDDLGEGYIAHLIKSFNTQNEPSDIRFITKDNKLVFKELQVGSLELSEFKTFHLDYIRSVPGPSEIQIVHETGPEQEKLIYQTLGIGLVGKKTDQWQNMPIETLQVFLPGIDYKTAPWASKFDFDHSKIGSTPAENQPQFQEPTLFQFVKDSGLTTDEYYLLQNYNAVFDQSEINITSDKQVLLNSRLKESDVKQVGDYRLFQVDDHLKDVEQGEDVRKNYIVTRDNKVFLKRVKGQIPGSTKQFTDEYYKQKYGIPLNLSQKSNYWKDSVAEVFPDQGLALLVNPTNGDVDEYIVYNNKKADGSILTSNEFIETYNSIFDQELK